MVGPLLQATRTVPIVFTQTPDPVGAGYVASLARPGGNATGFTSSEYGMSGKWLQPPKEIAPQVTRAAVLRDPAIASGIAQFAVIQSVAPPLRVEVSPFDIRNADEIDRAVTAFALSTNGGLIVPASGWAITHRELILTLAARHKLPTVYYAPYYARLVGGAAVTWPLADSAQQPSKTAKIGILGSGTPATQGQWWAGFVQRLRELGWIEGRTVALEYRWAEGRSERAAVRRQAMPAHRSLLGENRTTHSQCEFFAF